MRDQRSQAGDRYPGYDVMKKRFTPSWNEQTRRVIERRLAVRDEPRFFTPSEFETVCAIAARIVPQQHNPEVIPVAALVDHKLHQGVSDGYRLASMPREGEAWRIGLAAIDAESGTAHGARFAALSPDQQDRVLARVQGGSAGAAEWGTMSPSDFFKKRMARDLVLAYYSHPAAWSEIGWGGPASPRGYVRLDFNDRDPWEAAEAKVEDDVSARRMNRHVG
ncbi:hypothetical protein ABIB06_002137 [Bradyrhizobium sp. LB8.2]